MSRMKKEKFDRLADAELDIMRVLWDSTTPMRVSDIVKKLSATRSWKTQTAHVLLGRLEDREFIEADRSGYFHTFSAKISEREYFAIESDSLRRRIGGNFHALVASLIDSEDVSEEEIDEITHILARKKAEIRTKQESK